MNTNRAIFWTCLIVAGVFGFMQLYIYVFQSPHSTKAASNMLHITLKMQGTYKNLSKVKVAVGFYNGPTKAYDQPTVDFVAMNGVFESDIPLSADFSFSQPYALFIKPDKYSGRVFCLEKVTGATCTVPSFRFMQSGSSVDLTDSVFYGGDVNPANGKIDAKDLSDVMAALGKMQSGETAQTDINSDGITDVVDYSLTLYSLSQNIADDPINLTVGPTFAPSPTLAPSVTKAPTPTTAPSVTPKPTIFHSPTPTASPSATPKPTAKPSVTPTKAPTPTTKPSCLPQLEQACKARKLACVNNKCVVPSATPIPKPTDTSPSPTPTGSQDKVCRVTISSDPPKTYSVAEKKSTACQCRNIFGSVSCFISTCSSCPSGICTCQINAVDNSTTTYSCSDNGYLQTEPCTPQGAEADVIE